MNIELYEQRINMLYDYLHNEDLQDNYKVKKIDVEKINMSDIELPEGPDSDEILKYLLKQNLQYLFTINDDIYFKILSNNVSTIMKISLNKNKLNDNLISYILSELVLKKKTNNILLPIININVNISDLKPLLKSIDNLPNIYKNNFNKNKIISVKIREGFYNLMTLRDYINTESNIDYKILLFNIIIAIETIKLTYRYFSHNNLTLDNIFIYNKNTINNIIEFNNIVYNLPNMSYEIKITNFEKSKISNINNDEIIINEIKDNNDLIFIVKDILKINKNIDLITKNFLTKLRDMKNNNIESLTDNYFSEYIKNTNNLLGSRKIKDLSIVNKDKKIINRSEKMTGGENITRNEKITRFESEKMTGDNKKMTGGGEKPSVVPYKAEKNNPFRTNDERNTFNKKQEDVTKPRTPPVLVEQTIYDTSSSKPAYQPPPPVYVPVYDHNNHQIAVPFTSHTINPALSQPVIKQYNVSLANPLHNFSTVTRIYEDVLPGDPRSFSFTTTYERKQLINFIRNLLNNNTDGEDMIVTGGKNSLLSSMKLLDLNPYTISNTPHLDLAKNFLLFRAAYPIRYDHEKHNVTPSKSSHGVNVRIYNLSIGEMFGNEINQNLSNFDFDMWRELCYYKYILDNIIEKRISPNFVSFILTKKDKLSNVNWSELHMIQNRKLDIINKPVLGDNKMIILKNNINKNIIIKLLHINNKLLDANFIKKLSIYPYIKIVNIDSNDTSTLGLIHKFNITAFPKILFKVDNNYINYIGNIDIYDIINFINSNIMKLDDLIDLRKNSGESLVLLTESPHSNIIKWASPLYETTGALKKMIGTGFHKSEVWESVLFQIMHILYILYEEEIYFEELSLENNIYIKDLYYDSNNLNYWIYNIDGFEYYVPNYGYLVLFDSKYSDLKSGNYKIRSKKLYPNKNDKIKETDDATYNFDYKDNILTQFKNIFDPNIFNSQFKKLGCLEPDNSILDLLRNISSYNAPNINLYIKTFFSKYLNNRIGKYLTRTEKESINLLNRPTFKKNGELLIKQERFDEYRWVLFDSNVDALQKNIIIKDSNCIISTEICNSYSLILYSLSEKIKPIGIEENKIIETYIK